MTEEDRLIRAAFLRGNWPKPSAGLRDRILEQVESDAKSQEKTGLWVFPAAAPPSHWRLGLFGILLLAGFATGLAAGKPDGASSDLTLYYGGSGSMLYAQLLK